MATQIPSLLFFRFLQGLGAAPGLVLGPGVIGDIYKIEERGRAMSVFLSVSPVISRSLYFQFLLLQIDMFTGTRTSTSSWRYVSSAVSYHHYFRFTEKFKVRLHFISLGGPCNFIWQQLASFNSAVCIPASPRPPNPAQGVSINCRGLIA